MRRCAGASGRMNFCKKAAAAGQGVRILRQDAWEMLVTFLISQRKSIPGHPHGGRNAGRNLRRTAAPAARPTPKAARCRTSSPPPRRCCAPAKPACAAAGSVTRAPYIAQAARRVAEGSLDLAALAAADDETIDAALREVKGVGPKVANCVLLFGYGRTGRVPHDTWIIRLIRDVYAGADPVRRLRRRRRDIAAVRVFSTYSSTRRIRPARPPSHYRRDHYATHRNHPVPARKFSTARSSG